MISSDVGATREGENLEAAGECKDCCTARPVDVDVIPGATADLGRGREPGDETLPMASYLWTISVIDGRRVPPTREPLWGTDRPEGVAGVSNFPSEVDFAIGNTSRDCGRPREAAVGVPEAEFTADICFM